MVQVQSIPSDNSLTYVKVFSCMSTCFFFCFTLTAYVFNAINTVKYPAKYPANKSLKKRETNLAVL